MVRVGGCRSQENLGSNPFHDERMLWVWPPYISLQTELILCMRGSIDADPRVVVRASLSMRGSIDADPHVVVRAMS